MVSNRVQEYDLRSLTWSLMVFVLVVGIQITKFLFVVLSLA